MKYSIVLILLTLLSNGMLQAQKVKIEPSDSLRVFGEVEKPITFFLEDLMKCVSIQLDDLVIVNHNGEVKDTLTGLFGVPLKYVLKDIQYLSEKPKNLNELYFVFTATDGYKVVFSWNEIYNSDVGNNLFFITAMEEKKLHALDQRIMFVSTTDLITGRRFIKGLASIEIRRAD